MISNVLFKVSIGGDNGVIRIYSPSLSFNTSFQAHSSIIFRIKQSTFNGAYVGTCSDDNTVKIWDASSSTNWNLIRTYSNHFAAVLALEFITFDTVSSAGYDRSIRIWSISTGQTQRTINTNSFISCLQLLTNGIHLASCNSNNNIQIYNLNDGSLIKTLTGHSDWVRDLVQIKNTNLLASSSDDRTIRIWDLNTNTTKFILNGHTDNVYGLKQVTGDVLSSGSYDNTVRLWNITSGTLLRNLSHTYWIWYSVDVLSDGQTVVSGSIAQVIRLWNVQNGQTLNTFNTGSTINSLAVIKQTSSAIRKK